MPLYEYACENCQKIHEIFKKNSSDSEAHCPDCGEKMEKIVSGCTFVKGNGKWFSSGYS